MAKAKKTQAKNETPEPAKVVNPAVGDNLVDNPGDAADKGPVTEQAKGDKHSKETHEAMKPYLKAYPEADHFLLSSDGQVFLPHNHLYAKEHQQKLDPEKKVIKYSRK
ncbi:MAG: hypothetical protein ACTHK8_19025 [Ginsengibacter sp.]